MKVMDELYFLLWVFGWHSSHHESKKEKRNQPNWSKKQKKHRRFVKKKNRRKKKSASDFVCVSFKNKRIWRMNLHRNTLHSTYIYRSQIFIIETYNKHTLICKNMKNEHHHHHHHQPTQLWYDEKKRKRFWELGCVRSWPWTFIGKRNMFHAIKRKNHCRNANV